MLSEIKKIIKTDSKLQLLLLSGLIIQIITSVTAIGFYHPDQHFQIIEFSSYQSGNESSASQVWELHYMVRPTLQVYLFSAFYNTCQLFKIYDPYLQLTLLRVIFGVILFIVFNLISIYYFRNEKSALLYWVL